MTAVAASLKILFVTPECAPWAKTGGLGDVSAALPAALGALGHDVRVLMPAYRALAPLVQAAEERVSVPAQGVWPAATLAAVKAEGFTLWLLDCPALYGHPGGPYGDEHEADVVLNAERFGFLSQVAARMASAASPWPQWRAQVLHGNDWPLGLAFAYLRQMPAPRAAGVFTIHNLAFQGNFPVSHARALDLPPGSLHVDGLLHWGQISMMKAALRYADALTTVSPTYAREIQQEPLGFGLDGMLRYRAADLHGILNGIDTRVWNPATDPLIAARYSQASMEGKRVNKAALQAQMGLAPEPGALLFGMVSRLTEQKGIDLLLGSLDWIVEQGCQLVVLGSGETDFEQGLRKAAAAHPSQMAVRLGFDEPLAHLIEAGADCFLMPSRFEPCGLNQMYSQAYGTLPIVRATGGLADSVRDAGSGEGTGFAFEDDSAAALQQTMARAQRTFLEAAAWRSLQERAMAQQYTWAASAARYVEVYRSLQPGI
jgi:starch synthase